MAIYSIARRTTNVTSGNAGIELIASSVRRIRLMEAGLFLGAATASTYSLGRPAAAGITPTAPVLLLPEDPSDPNATTTTSSTALAWGTSPTNPTNDLRRIGLPATIGTGVIFTFPKGIVIAASATFVWQNLATNGVVDAYFVVDE